MEKGKEIHINDLAGQLRTAVAKELGFNSFKLDDNDKKEVVRLLGFRDKAELPKIVAIFNNPDKYADQRGGKTATVAAVETFLNRYKWFGANGATAERDTTPKEKALERPPKPQKERIDTVPAAKPEPSTTPEVPDFNAILANLGEQRVETSEINLGSMKGLEALAEIARGAEQPEPVKPQPPIPPRPPEFRAEQEARSAPPIPPEIESLRGEREVGAELLAEPVSEAATNDEAYVRTDVELPDFEHDDLVEAIAEVGEQEQSVEAPREARRMLDMIPEYPPERTMVRKFVDFVDKFIRQDIDTPTVKIFETKRKRSRELNNLVNEFTNGRMDMIAVLAKFDIKADEFVDHTDHTLFNATVPTFRVMAESYASLNPDSDVQIFQERQKDGAPNYAIPIGDLDENTRHFIVFRFREHGAVGKDFDDLYQNDPLEFIVQNLMEYGDFESLLSAHQSLANAGSVFRSTAAELAEAERKVADVAAGVYGKSAQKKLGQYEQEAKTARDAHDLAAQALDIARDAVEKRQQIVFGGSGFEKRAAATRELLQDFAGAASLAKAFGKERQQLDKRYKDYEEERRKGGDIRTRLSVPTELYDLLASLGYDVSHRPRLSPEDQKAYVTTKNYPALRDRALDQHPSVNAIKEQVSRIVSIFSMFAINGESNVSAVTNREYANGIATLQSFLENPTYEKLAEVGEVLSRFEEQIRVQLDKYYLEMTQGERRDKYFKELKISGLNSEQEDWLERAMAFLDVRVFRIFEDQLLGNLKGMSREAAFNQLTDWMEQEAVKLSAAEAGADILMPYLERLADIAAETYEEFQEKQRSAFSKEEKAEVQRLQTKYESIIRLLVDMGKVDREDRTLFTSPTDDEDELERRNEYIRETIVRKLGQNKNTATELINSLRTSLKDVAGQQVISMLERSVGQDGRGRQRSREGDNTLFDLITAHEKVAAIVDQKMKYKDNMPEKDKQELWRQIRESFAPLLKYINVIADLRDGSQDNHATVAQIGETARIINKLLDETKTETSKAVSAALAAKS